LVSRDWEDNLIISDVARGVALHTFEGHTGMIWEAGFAAQGSLLVTFGEDGMRLWGGSQELRWEVSLAPADHRSWEKTLR
jgi:hypothetical protein